MRAALFATHFAAGRDIGRIDVLVEVGRALDLDASELKAGLDVDRWSAQVEREDAEARRLRIDRFPALIVGGGRDARLLLGPQDLGSLRSALDAGAP
jgi:predicted DsbA family dithiol-disulfide isomerase